MLYTKSHQQNRLLTGLGRNEQDLKGPEAGSSFAASLALTRVT